MAVLARVGSTFNSDSADITGMRTPRRLDFLPLEANQLPTSSNTEQPPRTNETATSASRRLREGFILFRRRRRSGRSLHGSRALRRRGYGIGRHRAVGNGAAVLQ